MYLAACALFDVSIVICLFKHIIICPVTFVFKLSNYPTVGQGSNYTVNVSLFYLSTCNPIYLYIYIYTYIYIYISTNSCQILMCRFSRNLFYA